MKWNILLFFVIFECIFNCFFFSVCRREERIVLLCRCRFEGCDDKVLVELVDALQLLLKGARLALAQRRRERGSRESAGAAGAAVLVRALKPFNEEHIEQLGVFLGVALVAVLDEVADLQRPLLRRQLAEDAKEVAEGALEVGFLVVARRGAEERRERGSRRQESVERRRSVSRCCCRCVIGWVVR